VYGGLRLQNKLEPPIYFDKTLELLEEYLNDCGYLKTHCDCDGCSKLSSCVKAWDHVCTLWEDKEIPATQTKPLVEKIQVVLLT
jgi:hypothetical protein